MSASRIEPELERKHPLPNGHLHGGQAGTIHLLDGLPANAILRRTGSGRVAAVHGWITAGFVRDDRYFTREQAAAVMAHQA